MTQSSLQDSGSQGENLYPQTQLSYCQGKKYCKVYSIKLICHSMMRKVTAKLSNLNFCQGTSLVVNWLWLHTCKAGGPGPIPGQGLGLDAVYSVVSQVKAAISIIFFHIRAFDHFLLLLLTYRVVSSFHNKIGQISLIFMLLGHNWSFPDFTFKDRFQ